jgi:hypothetical protein
MRSWRPLTSAQWQFVAGMAILIWCACAPSRPTPLNFSGDWAGTTSQGRPITFTVSSDLRITTMTVDFAFAGCAGSVTVAPNTALTNTNGTAAALVVYTPNGSTGPSRAVVNFLFPSITSANGTAQFFDYPTCGSSNATWTASKR